MNSMMIKSILMSFICYAQSIAPDFFHAEGIRFVIVIPSYNNKAWYEKNLHSVLMQTYHNYRVVYINDCSTDETGELVDRYIKEHAAQNIVKVINNSQRQGALANIYAAVHQCSDKEVMVLLDGDDWLAHEDVLLKLSEEYAKNKSWLVYTQFVQWPKNDPGWNKAVSLRAYQAAHSPRDYSPSHLRTFYAGLFKKIHYEDLLHEGAFFAMTWDMAIMLPMVEMASNGHVKFLPEVMYIYNHSNPLSDHVVDVGLQRKLHEVIAAKKKYAPLKECPF